VAGISVAGASVAGASVAGASVAAGAQAVNNTLAITNSESKANKRFIFLLQIEFVNSFVSSTDLHDNQADNALFCQHHLLWLGSVRSLFSKKPEKTLLKHMSFSRLLTSNI
jgi:hypothetical protein